MRLTLETVYENGRKAGYTVTLDGRYGDRLNADEALGVVAAALYAEPGKNPHMGYLQDHDNYARKRSESQDRPTPRPVECDPDF